MLSQRLDRTRQVQTLNVKWANAIWKIKFKDKHTLKWMRLIFSKYHMYPFFQRIWIAVLFSSWKDVTVANSWNASSPFSKPLSEKPGRQCKTSECQTDRDALSTKHLSDSGKYLTYNCVPPKISCCVFALLNNTFASNNKVVWNI